MATNPMSLTTAKAVARAPHSYTTQELDDALTVIVDSPDLTEAQVTRLQGLIDPVLRSRLATPPPPSRIWCDECHYWHASVNECAYVTKVGA